MVESFGKFWGPRDVALKGVLPVPCLSFCLGKKFELPYKKSMLHAGQSAHLLGCSDNVETQPMDDSLRRAAEAEAAYAPPETPSSGVSAKINPDILPSESPATKRAKYQKPKVVETRPASAEFVDDSQPVEDVEEPAPKGETKTDSDCPAVKTSSHVATPALPEVVQPIDSDAGLKGEPAEAAEEDAEAAPKEVLWQHFIGFSILFYL